MQEKSAVGIDLSKRSMAVVRLTDGGEKIQRGTFSTNHSGRERLMKWLKPEVLFTLKQETVPSDWQKKSRG